MITAENEDYPVEMQGEEYKRGSSHYSNILLKKNQALRPVQMPP
jgi:hypothetical protein